MLGAAATARHLTATALALLLGLSTAGCAAGAVGGVFDPEVPTSPAPGPAPAPVAPLGPRVIPLRIVVLVNCDRCRDCGRSCRRGPPQENFDDCVAAANEVFAPAGVRFEIGSIERIETADWWLNNAKPVDRRWRDIRPQALRLFPWMPENAWADADTVKGTDAWIHVITAAYSRPHEITIYVQAGHTRAGTEFPNEGRGMWTSDGTFGSRRGGMLYLFAHELGHYLGLRHTFGHAGTNPITRSNMSIYERWDLIYRPGSGPDDPHRFFSSREEAAAFPERELRLIQESHHEGSNCVAQRDGGLVCEMEGRGGYGETHSSGEDALKGLVMPLAGHPRFRWARNAVDYGDMQIPRRLSPSQIAMIKMFLANPMFLLDKSRRRWGGYPDGIGTLPSYRTTLGREPPAAAE